MATLDKKQLITLIKCLKEFHSMKRSSLLKKNLNSSNDLLHPHKKIIKSSSKNKIKRFYKESHNSASEDSEENEDQEGAEDNDTDIEKETGKNEKSEIDIKPEDALMLKGSPKTNNTDKDKSTNLPLELNGGSIHYVDACTLWKFPTWLVDRLQCSNVIDNAEILHSQQIRITLMEQLKATSTDLIMYATVRREFLRTIVLIELNNVARLLEVAKSVGVNETLKTKFFEYLQPCVNVLDDENKSFSQCVIDLALIIDEIYVSISPSLYLREQNAYDYNNIYCSYLVPGRSMQFTELCCGGIIDNTWFSLECKYRAMVMVTPHVYDDPKGIQRGILKEEKYRVEAYFDVARGCYTAFDKHFKSTIASAYRNKICLEHLVFSFFSKSEHYVEEKSVFLMNGPETKGNITFAKIYHALVRTAVL